MASVKKNSSMSSQVGRYSFLAGILIAVIAGIFTDLLDPSIVPLLLIVLGLIVGFLNVTATETTEFLVAGIALVLISVPAGLLEQIPVIGFYLSNVLLNISVFVVFAVLIVALKAIWELAEN